MIVNELDINIQSVSYAMPSEVMEFVLQLKDGLITVSECVFKLTEWGYSIQTINAHGLTLQTVFKSGASSIVVNIPVNYL